MQKRKIQMIVYDGSRVGAFVSALLLALVFIGALPPEDRKVNEMLKVQQQNTVALIQRQAADCKKYCAFRGTDAGTGASIKYKRKNI